VVDAAAGDPARRCHRRCQHRERRGARRQVRPGDLPRVRGPGSRREGRGPSASGARPHRQRVRQARVDRTADRADPAHLEPRRREHLWRAADAVPAPRRLPTTPSDYVAAVWDWIDARLYEP
jgi:hypothetical protein